MRYSENPHDKKKWDEKSKTKFMVYRFHASAPFYFFGLQRIDSDLITSPAPSSLPFYPLPQYYGPMGKDWIFDNNGLSGAGPLGPP